MALCFATQSLAAEPVGISLTVGSKQMLSLPDVHRLAVDDPLVLDVSVARGGQVTLQGLAEGQSTLVVWLGSEERTYEVSVRKPAPVVVKKPARAPEMRFGGRAPAYEVAVPPSQVPAELTSKFLQEARNQLGDEKHVTLGPCTRVYDASNTPIGYSLSVTYAGFLNDDGTSAAVAPATH